MTRRAISPGEGLPILTTSLSGVAKAALYCAHGMSTASSCAFCEQGGHLAAPFLILQRPRVARAEEHSRPFGLKLHRQMPLHHFRAQLTALARHHHRPFGHHDILLRQPSGKVEPLFDQQNGQTGATGRNGPKRVPQPVGVFSIRQDWRTTLCTSSRNPPSAPIAIQPRAQPTRL